MGSIRTLGVTLAGALLLGSAVTAAPAAGAALAGTQPCQWTPAALPTIPGGTGGTVLGGDGGDRFGGYVWKSERPRAVLWRAGQAYDLGAAFPNGSYVHDVNRYGNAVGQYLQDGVGRPVLWRGGTAISLANPPGLTYLYATAINDAGLIVGWGSAADGATHGVLWSTRAPSKARDLGSGDGHLYPYDISDRSIVVGTTISGPPRHRTQAFAANRNGKLRRLPGSADDTDTQARAVAGKFLEYVAGLEYDPVGGQQHAALWRHGVLQQLPGGAPGLATAVNKQGLVAGELWNDEISGAVVWRNGAVERLPGPNGGPSFHAAVVTDDGRVAGESSAGPTVWSCN